MAKLVVMPKLGLTMTEGAVSRWLKAEGEAEAIRKVQEATAEAIKLLNQANASEAVVKLKALEAFQAAADGKATKIIIPSEIQALAGLCASAKVLLEGDEKDAPAPRK